ncbi:hypothetical protein S7711_08729 [Stachybotrys chartarum IBT 7711]|uniref:DNA mismatch repair protein S5 domain-containing protein n=1 Tax=Stachybotrys chartarum (strain CBS 109288 / IBT 7711) TaxID=1280523 RepID=A0A084AK26_STACB|nr:hypothetical protein S7711_08729 [Stachybotrys chartarum IBT 7711]KFA48408.1 hypothetical protein S40293_00339 [Stachybotrys chartarum IBT 40293]
MKIAELPQSTVRLLSSSVSIATPHDLIKELLDNAIDAKATSIEIGISANTIDKIQVRDNGYGIDVDDLDCLGRKAHTSKLEHFEELPRKGGLTLGFRGEALASANCLSTIVITTRTSDDPVASRVVINSNVGGVRHRQPSSALVGTTIEATRLFEHVPVRKQTALKQSHKSLVKIKELVHCYALARPDLKLVFKVLGEGKPRWSHAPTSPPKFREAAIQIVDASVASNYLELYSSRNGRVLTHQEFQRQSSPDNLTLQALLPRPDCKVRTIKSRGPFVSVDGRPLCAARGLPKKLASILKPYLQKAFVQSPGVHNPFFYLGLRCPPGSYDPNVSPSKDEVLFDNEGEVLDRFRELCEHVYGLVGNVQPSDMLTSSMAKQAQGRLEEYSTTTLQTECLQRSHIIGEVMHKPLIQSTELANDRPEQCYGVQQTEPETRFTEPLQVQVPQDQFLPRAPRCSSSNLDPGGTALESAKMRTVMVVDLSRKISDATDENCTVDMADVQVSPKKAKLASHQGQTNTASGPSAHLWAGSIERYFKPRGTNDFEILIDEPVLTDQSSPLTVRTETLEGSSAKGKLRQPLQPLSPSVLNRMNHEADAQQSVFSSTGINESRAFPHSAFSTGEDPSSPFPARGVRRTEAEEAEPETTGPIRTPPRSSDTVRQVQESYLTARPMHQAHTLRMPSSSGPPIRQDARLSLPRPRLSGITTAGHTAEREQQTQRRRNRAIGGNRPERTLPRTNPDCSQMLNLDGSASSQPILGDGITINASSPSPSFMANRAFNQMLLSRDPGSTLEDTADPCEPVDRFPEPPTQPASLAQVQYSHFVQTLLLKTPPLGEAESNLGPPERPPAHPTQSGKTDIDKSLNYTAAGTEVVTDQNCCDHVRSRNRKRSRTNIKLFRRTTSSTLPLERVPSGEEVQDLVAQVQLKGEDVERLMKQCENAGLELPEDLIRKPINSQGLLEDEKMERALRAVMGSWLEARVRDGKGDMDIAVAIEEMHASGGQHK